MRKLFLFIFFLSACQMVTATPDFVDNRFNQMMIDRDPNGFNYPTYLHPDYIIQKMGNDYLWIQDCQLQENKIGYLKYRCDILDEYQNCREKTSNPDAVRQNCQAKSSKYSQIIEFIIDEKNYTQNRKQIKSVTHEIYPYEPQRTGSKICSRLNDSEVLSCYPYTNIYFIEDIKE